MGKCHSQKSRSNWIRIWLYDLTFLSRLFLPWNEYSKSFFSSSFWVISIQAKPVRQPVIHSVVRIQKTARALSRNTDCLKRGKIFFRFSIYLTGFGDAKGVAIYHPSPPPTRRPNQPTPASANGQFVLAELIFGKNLKKFPLRK